MFGIFPNKTHNNLLMLVALLSDDYPSIESVLDLSYEEQNEISKYKKMIKGIKKGE